MKILRLIILCLLVLGLSGNRAESNQESKRQRSEDIQSNSITGVNGDEISEKIKTIIDSKDEEFRIRLMELAADRFSSGAKTDLEKLRRELTKIESGIKSPRKNILILFLQAETNYRLKEFQDAHRQYLQLKFSLDDNSDPLFSEVERRLETAAKKIASMRKKASFEDKINKIKPNLSFLYVLVLLIFITYLFLIWHRKFSPTEKGKDVISSDDYSKESPSTIVPKKSLISLDELCKQDGRVSFSAVKKYEANRENWKPKEEDQTSKYARLIFEGHEMIKRVNQLAPYPLAVVSRVPLINRFPPFWRYTLIGFIFIILWGFFKDISGENFTSVSYVSLFLIAALVISSLTGLRIMATNTINSLDELVCMMEVVEDPRPSEKIPQSIRELEKWIRELFRGPWQFYVVMIIFIIILSRSSYLNTIFNQHNYSPLIELIFILLILLITCPIIWFILASLFTLNKIYKMKDLAVNPLSPIKTMGLEKWISLIGTCNVTASIVLTFGCSIPVITGYINGNGSGRWFWFTIIMPLLFVYWVYPYLKLGELVKDMKRKRMQFTKSRIAQIFNAWVKFEEDQLEEVEKRKASDTKCDIEEIFGYRTEMMEKLKPHLDTMENYYKVFKKIDESPQSYIDVYSALELAKAMGIPSLFAIVSVFLF